MALTLTAQVSFLAEYYDRLLLDNLYPDLYLWQFGDKKRVPAGEGKVAYFTRYDTLAITDFAQLSAALTEGTVTVPIAMSATTLTATLAGHGAAVGHSDFLVMTSLSDVISDSVHEVAKVLAVRIEQIIETAISAGGTILAASNVATSTVVASTPLFATDIVRAVTKLRAGNAKTFPDGNLVGRFHPNQIHDLMVDTTTGGWVDVNKYANSETVGHIYRGEVGKLYGVRAIMSAAVPSNSDADADTSAAVSGGTANSTFQAYIMGPGAYGVVELDGGGAKTYIKQLGSAGTADPINQNATVGAKIYFAALGLDLTNRFIRIASGVSTV